MRKHLCGLSGERVGTLCAACEVVEHNQERAFDRGWCGAIGAIGLVCDRESGHGGDHCGYNVNIDEPMFWPAKGRRSPRRASA